MSCCREQGDFTIFVPQFQQTKDIHLSPFNDCKVAMKKSSGVDAPAVTPSRFTPMKEHDSSSASVPARQARAPSAAAISARRRVLEDEDAPRTRTPSPPPRTKERTAACLSRVAVQMSAAADVSRRGNRSRNAAIAASTSSPERVVWHTTPTGLDGSNGRFATSSEPFMTRHSAPRISPTSPKVSAWSECPTTTAGTPRSAKPRKRRCARATNGQVASITRKFFFAAASRTEGETPCADKRTGAPSGTSSSESTNTIPFLSNSATTSALWTREWRQYTGGGSSARARLALSTAVLTPQQKPCGSIASTFMVCESFIVVCMAKIIPEIRRP